ncbi:MULTISPECIES: hypothetical protein [Lacticaseibacillus]|jgi:hypothetical protein|uniref:hypothetical protein n=1 Tax=Lacticaseibacillus TaxID=2759736 RepID=UPI000AE16759|nr:MULTISPECIES: hypothetical protein [Lacticaseibacillus]DAL74480.1 MAG TPA: Protein of unknown function (DUF1056) [Caudoviricetes sp.]
MAKIISNLFSNWGTVMLFIIGLALIAVAAFTFNVVIGYLVAGLETCLAAYILDKERG